MGSERKKVYVLAGLLVVLAGSLYYSLFAGSSPAPPPPPAESAPSRNADAGGSTEIAENVGPGEPLPLAWLNREPVGEAVARNPFAYPPPPPPPPPKPEPQKPVATLLIGNVTPNSVTAGIPRGVDVTVTGRDFPVDARVMWNGRMMRTQRLSAEQLRVSLTQADVASAGSIRVKVVSESQPLKLWSDERAFDIREAPRPSFQYIGRVGDVALVDYGGQGNQKPVRVGDMIGQPAIWRVVAIAPDKIDLLDTRNDIPRSLPLNRRER
jgi:hypothetical protein